MDNLKKIFNNKKGFTLVELMISIVILTFVMGTVYSLINSSSRLVWRQVNTTNAQNDIRTAADWITRDLKEAVSFNSANEGNVLYIVEKGNSTVKYIKTETGKISNNKIYKVIRKSNNEEFVMLENIPEEGFNIENKNSLYHVTITIKDKLNKDKVTEFDVSSKMNSDVANEPGDGEEDNGDPNKPYIDIDNNDKFDGKDYNIKFINGVYDWRKDEKYEKGILVFSSDFIVSSSLVTCIARDGIRIDKNVTMGTKDTGSIQLITDGSVIGESSMFYIKGHGNKNGSINITAKKQININNSSINVNSHGSFKQEPVFNIYAGTELNAINMNMSLENGGGSNGSAVLKSGGSIDIDNAVVNVIANGNKKSDVSVKIECAGALVGRSMGLGINSDGGTGYINVISKGSLDINYSALEVNDREKKNSQAYIDIESKGAATYYNVKTILNISKGKGYIRINDMKCEK